jgi:putative DNA primase/helicase
MLHDDWDRFLDLITCGDTDLQDYLQQIAGMALVGEVYEESLIMCYGTGSNGKSTLFQIWAQLMGTYADSVRNEVILGNRWGGEVTGADQLRGKRLIITSELEESQVMSSALMKKLTSRDPINANVKYAKAITFRPTHTLVLHTNHLPRLKSVDHGTVRRIAVVPFKAQISESEKRTDFAEELIRNEGPAILAWMINGAVSFYNAHMTIQKPSVVVEESRRYIEGEDILNRFVQDRCEMEGKAYISTLYVAFKNWCEDDGTFCKYGRNKFAEELKNRLKLKSDRDAKGTYIEGISIQEDGL